MAAGGSPGRQSGEGAWGAPGPASSARADGAAEPGKGQRLSRRRNSRILDFSSLCRGLALAGERQGSVHVLSTEGETWQRGRSITVGPGTAEEEDAPGDWLPRSFEDDLQTAGRLACPLPIQPLVFETRISCPDRGGDSPSPHRDFAA